MKKTLNLCILVLFVLMASCGAKRERFNYTLIKSKMELTSEQASQFDNITQTYSKKARAAYEGNSGNKEAAMKAVNTVFQEQDAKIKEILDADNYKIYASEIKIEREGREKYNMKLIKQELNLDSAQNAQFDLTNEAFYTTLIDNHDNYHGKPDVYLQYYAEIDVNRRDAFKKFMSDTQYQKYLSLVEKYGIGKSEH